MTAELLGWQYEHPLDDRRRSRNAMLVSLAIHGSVFAAFAISPARPVVPMPEVIAIELIAALPAASRPARRAPAPPPAEPAPAAPPVQKAPVQVLPEETPGRIARVIPEPPKPKVVAKPEPEPKAANWRPTRQETKELSYEEAMAALDDDIGIDETASLLRPALKPDDSSEQTEASDRSRTGLAVSPELAAWNLATRRLLQSKWITPPNFRNRGLATSLEFRLSASGTLIGTPKVLRSSGDPYFDDNAVRALLTVAPLPPPPEPGSRIFLFNAEAN